MPPRGCPGCPDPNALDIPGGWPGRPEEPRDHPVPFSVPPSDRKAAHMPTPDQVFFAFFATSAATSFWLLLAIGAQTFIPPYLDRQEARDA